MTLRRLAFAAAVVVGVIGIALHANQPLDGDAEAAAPFKVRKVSTYVDDVGTYHLVGEVVNQTNRKLQRVEVSAAFMNAAGKVIRTEYAYSCVDILGPGGSSPFDIVVADPPAIARYKTGVTAYPTTDPVVTGLTASAGKPTVDENKIVHVKGRVKNGSTKTYQYVEICGALLNPARTRIIRAGYAFPSNATLKPGVSRDYDWQLFDKLPKNLVAQVWVDGLPK